MREAGPLIPAAEAAGEFELAQPGAIVESVRVNFAEPALVPFAVRLGLQPFADAEPSAVLEVHQPHPRGTAWATLEFEISPPSPGAVVEFDARLLPGMQVELKLYIPGAELDLAALPVNHRINRFRVEIEDEVARRAAEAPVAQLGFTLPQRSWFVFQLSDLRLRAGGT